jgi:hypothetical protein
MVRGPGGERARLSLPSDSVLRDPPRRSNERTAPNPTQPRAAVAKSLTPVRIGRRPHDQTPSDRTVGTLARVARPVLERSPSPSDGHRPVFTQLTSGAVRDLPDGVSLVRAKSDRRINRCCVIASQPPLPWIWPYVCSRHRKGGDSMNESQCEQRSDMTVRMGRTFLAAVQLRRTPTRAAHNEA